MKNLKKKQQKILIPTNKLSKMTNNIINFKNLEKSKIHKSLILVTSHV